ncbi:MAG: DUF5686 and carboxypeptidase regulatory-like domain-containing protein [Chitinophagaceae bacterium]|nr:DUF5686 and carboxypeptidase regulatory-like domain-containing protein [Chitinophagaceae bacterium]
MNQRLILLLLGFVLANCIPAQPFMLSGVVKNNRLEPLPFASVQVKGITQGVITDEKGEYHLELFSGEYEIVISMIGYQSQVIKLVVSGNTRQDVILKAAAQSLSEVVIKGKIKDRSEEYIRQVIRRKDQILDSSGRYTCEVYIRAVQEGRTIFNTGRKKTPSDTSQLFLQGMAMAEIYLKYYQADRNRYKEERTGVTTRGNPDGLFFQSMTEADLNLYNNLIRARSLSQTPFISPVSWSGLEAYRFRMLRTDFENGRKIHTIGIRARSLSNATISGMIRVAEDTWTIVEARYKLPKYHVPEYDDFEVIQYYYEPSPGISAIQRQEFRYSAKQRKGVLSGTTSVDYRNYNFSPVFPDRFFSAEKAVTTAEAYERDSSYWNGIRSTPLSKMEIAYMHYADSIRRVQTSKAWLDSVDRQTNRVTFGKIAWKGQTIYNREKERTWDLPAVAQLLQPFQLGGLRINPVVWYDKGYKNKKHLNIFTDLSYGIRNKDLNGSFRLNRLYNPFSRGYYHLNLERNFDFIFSGDAWINMIQRSNFYLNNGVSFVHGLELANGLFFTTTAQFSMRRSVSDYKTNSRIDSLFGDILDNNQPVDFEPYNALYGSVKLAYTPAQQYMREPREKIILGSKWPTFYAEWRKGIPGIMKSVVDFNYLEFGIQQELKIGILGNSNYTFKTGDFFSQKDLRLVDYKFQRRGDPLLFLNPNQAFQSLDSTFPVFKRFYEGHLVHEFNGALINKVPFLRRLKLREVAGAGFLLAPERKLRYGELFAGMERIFPVPFYPIGRLKLGVYIVGSAANRFSNPVQFKIGITTWDKRRNRWF